jgi:hypothetical protein
MAMAASALPCMAGRAEAGREKDARPDSGVRREERRELRPAARAVKPKK